MSKIVIIGGGFAGLSAAGRLCKFKKDLEVILIDKKGESHFLPALPDVIGKRITPEFLTYDITCLSKRWGFVLIKEEVTAVDLEKSEIKTNVRTLPYDYLIIASGSQTDFYGNQQIENCAYKLDNVYDAAKILETIEQKDFDNYIICGGGYTGIEIATNLRRYLNREVKGKRVIIVELAPSILGPLPEWMKEYVRNNLKKLNIDIFLNTSVGGVEDSKVSLSNGQIFDNTLLIWAAGVKVPDFVNNLNFEKSRQGRLNVDDYLRLSERCFVLGDCAQFSYQNSFLRMAVQFSLAQGQCAAENIKRLLKGDKLKKYKPLDLGYIIPMANNRSCGRILGIKMKGLLPTIFHYLMCIYRSYGLTNRLGIMKDVVSGGG
jgi:NADH dehydrogenase